MLSKEAQLFIEMCFNNGQPRNIKPVFGMSYELVKGEKLIKFTQELLEEIVTSDRVKVSMDGKNTAFIQGVKGGEYESA